jgi:hypothetical protein
MRKNNVIDMICALGGTNSLLEIYLSRKGVLKKAEIKEVHDIFDKSLEGYCKEAYASEDWHRVMSVIDQIRQIPDEEFFLTGKNKRLVLDSFQITKLGTFWVFWYGSEQHVISFQHIPNEPNLSTATSYFDALEKSVNAFYELKSKLMTD